jgi:hypothetical protein
VGRGVRQHGRPVVLAVVLGVQGVGGHRQENRRLRICGYADKCTKGCTGLMIEDYALSFAAWWPLESRGRRTSNILVIYLSVAILAQANSARVMVRYLLLLGILLSTGRSRLSSVSRRTLPANSGILYIPTFDKQSFLQAILPVSLAVSIASWFLMMLLPRRRYQSSASGPV